MTKNFHELMSETPKKIGEIAGARVGSLSDKALTKLRKGSLGDGTITSSIRFIYIPQGERILKTLINHKVDSTAWFSELNYDSATMEIMEPFYDVPMSKLDSHSKMTDESIPASLWLSRRYYTVLCHPQSNGESDKKELDLLLERYSITLL